MGHHRHCRILLGRIEGSRSNMGTDIIAMVVPCWEGKRGGTHEVGHHRRGHAPLEVEGRDLRG
jgi:hypothetical protein